MIRVLVICLLSAASLLAQSKSPTPKKQAPAAVTPAKAPESKPKEAVPGVVASLDTVPPGHAVITVHGLCPAGGDAKAPACTTSVTREEFELIMKTVSPNQPLAPAMRRTLAQRYVELLAFAEASEKAGMEKTPEFAEDMRLARLRTLSEVYSRFLDAQYRNPSQAEIDAYFKEHENQFEQVTLSRVFVPKIDAANKAATEEQRAAYTAKAAQVADEALGRAGKGENMDQIQKDCYAKLGLGVTPPNTTVGPVRKGSLPAQQDKELFALAPGGVLKTDQPSGFTIFKVEGRQKLTLDAVRQEIINTLHKQNFDKKIKEITTSLPADFDDKYFVQPPAPPPAQTPKANPPGAQR